MKLIIPLTIVDRVKRELRRARTQEIGGVLVGEHILGEDFKLVDFSVQRSGGSRAHFVRDVALNKAFLDEFFAKTGNNFTKYNYIGEWHSHPLFRAHPSGPDFQSMYEIVEDPTVGVHFAVLLIFSLRFWTGMEMSATAFRAQTQPEPIEVELFDDTRRAPRLGVVARFLRFIRD